MACYSELREQRGFCDRGVPLVNINNPTTFSVPDLTFTTSNSSGTAGAIRADDSIAVFDGTTPAAVSTTAATGSAAVAARRDHVHVGTTVDNTLARYNGTAGALQGYTSGGPVASDTGQLTLPGNPVVSVTLGGTSSNATGNGTEFTIPYATEIVDRTSNYSNPTFTAPITGQYMVSATWVGVDIGSGNTSSYIKIKTSNRNYQWWVNPYYIYDANIGTVLELDAQCDMDASDTLTVTAAVYGGSQIVDILTDSALQISLIG